MKKTLLLLCILIGTIQVQAQGHMGLHSDNYAGIYNIHFQPADIVDGRYAFNMNLFQFDFTLANNYIALKKQALLESGVAFGDPNFQTNYLSENINGKEKKIFSTLNMQLPLSFYFTFGKKRKNALGFSSRFRSNINIAGIEEAFARQMYNELTITDLLNVGIQNKNFSAQTAVWGEMGITYGREIFDFGKHYIKGAFTGKINQGLMSYYTYSDNLNITFPTDSTVSVDNSDIAYDISSNIVNLDNPKEPQFGFTFRPTFSADIGFVYEWRPKYEAFKTPTKKDPERLDPKKNKYKLKASLSFTDIGFLRFKRTPHSKIIHANFNNVPTTEIGDVFSGFVNGGLASVDSAFNNSPRNLGTTSDPADDFYLMRLPFKINAMVDYHIWKGFYVNATASIAPSFKQDANKTIGISQYSITPRYEHRWVGVQLPLSIDGVGRFHLGTGLRLGPLVVGVNDIIPFLAGKNYKIYGANVYAGLNIPIFAHNKKEKQKKAKKVDTDGDGIPDVEDHCPTVAGLEKYNGCPDTDGDGIPDNKDLCPEIAGVEAFKGCPDTDGDGIPDSEDECPNIAGLKAFKGCPDTDGDGIPDKEDKCPTLKGPRANDGCPYEDADGDGVPDSEDLCPNVAGPAENKGCPYADTDKDGVIDKEDECINTPGPAENKGCPIVKEEVKEVIQTAFDNLQFVSGKAEIKSISYTSLRNLAKILGENNTLKLRIAGHTDSQGSAESNMILSRKRAEAVKTYLKQYGVADNRFIIEAYGETKPIADNNTAEGRQKNRRVEMEIVMD